MRTTKRSQMHTARTQTKPAVDVNTRALLGVPAAKESGSSTNVTTVAPTDPKAKNVTGRAHHPAPVVAASTASATPLGVRLQNTSAVDDRRANAPTRFASIDMGSSSAKLLVLERRPSGELTTVLDRKISTKLGQDTALGEAIPNENLVRTKAAISALVDDAVQLGVPNGEIGLISTAVMRNSTNGGAFLDELKSTLGLEKARILTGEQEAEIGFLGAIAMFADADDDADVDAGDADVDAGDADVDAGDAASAPGPAKKFASLDLGGGSFQLAVGSSSSMEQGGSTQVGSNTLLDGVLSGEFIDDHGFATADTWLKNNAAMPLPVAVLDGRTLVATGGVSKFLRVHFQNDRIEKSDVESLRKTLGAMSFQDRVAFVQGSKSDDDKAALGVDTDAGALDFGKKLVASATLLLHIMNGLSVTNVNVSETDARHAVIQQSMND